MSRGSIEGQEFETFRERTPTTQPLSHYLRPLTLHQHPVLRSATLTLALIIWILKMLYFS